MRPAGTGGVTTLALEVSVVSADGTPLPNRTVALALDGSEGTGGHDHEGTMPPGGLSAVSVNTGPSGLDTVTYSADVFGGSVQLQGSSAGAAPALETITIRVPGLVQLFEGGSVDTIGVTTTHPSNHWGTGGMVSALIALSDAFYAYTENARKLQINDISLSLGGKFDVAPVPINYNPGGDHKYHRLGTNADVRTHGDSPLTDEQRDFVYDWWESKFGKTNIFVHDGAMPHYHLTVP